MKNNIKMGVVLLILLCAEAIADSISNGLMLVVL